MKTNEENIKNSYLEPEVEVLDIRIESRLLDGSNEQGHGCNDDACPSDL